MDRTTEVPGGKPKGAPYGEGKSIELPALAGLSGAMRVDIHDQPVGTVHVGNGRVWAGPPQAQSEAVAVVEDRADFDRILTGELNPVVAAIQGRLVLRGEPELATRLISALNASRPLLARKGE
jgi:putative sterol carrier protein